MMRFTAIMTEPAHDLSRLRIDRDRPPPGVRRAVRWSAYLAIAASAVVIVVIALARGGGGPSVQVALAELRGGSAGASTGVTANGYVVARTQASVSSKITGRLEYLGVEEGSVVNRGAIIGRLESADYAAVLAQREAELVTARAALAESEAERDQLRRDVERARDLLAEGLISEQETEQLEARLSTAEARVERFRAQVQAAEAGYRAARRALYPDLTVSVGYGQRPQFDDFTTLTFGISIPVFAGSRQMPLRREMQAVQRMEEARELDLYNETFAQLAELRAQAERARSLSNLYVTSVLPQARAAVESALSAYRVGRVDYATLVMNEMTVNRYQIESVRLTAEYHRAVAQVEALVGATLGGER
ncbi:MAG: TolC family protein [Gemmatimonadota bacterium]|nr:MAG: TolC family protein [Gemmatimonadota bacterium]